MQVETKKNGCLLTHHNEKTFFPNRHDLKKSLELLELFNQAPSIDGRPLYSLWSEEGFYIYPALQEWLMWFCFVPIVAQQQCYQTCAGLSVQIKRAPYACIPSFFRLREILHHRQGYQWRVMKNLALHSLWRFTLRQDKGKVLFFDDGSQEIGRAHV